MVQCNKGAALLKVVHQQRAAKQMHSHQYTAWRPLRTRPRLITCHDGLFSTSPSLSLSLTVSLSLVLSVFLCGGERYTDLPLILLACPQALQDCASNAADHAVCVCVFVSVSMCLCLCTTFMQLMKPYATETNNQSTVRWLWLNTNYSGSCAVPCWTPLKSEKPTRAFLMQIYHSH